MTNPPTTIEQELRELRAFASGLLPEPNTFTLQVSPEQQRQELRQLQTGRRYEQFFFIVDFATLTIIEACGLEEIGYDSERFTFRQYLSMIPPGGMLQLVTLLGKQTFMISNQSLLDFLKPQFVAYLPLTHADGRVMLTKRTISPWQVTNTGRIAAYLSEFTILKPYENEPMNPRFVHLEPAIETLFNRLIARLFANQPASANPFSPKEIVILKLYVEAGTAELTAREVAKLAGITLSTAHTHNKNILLKAKTMFGETMPAKTARDVALFMKKCGLLG